MKINPVSITTKNQNLYTTNRSPIAKTGLNSCKCDVFVKSKSVSDVNFTSRGLKSLSDKLADRVSRHIMSRFKRFGTDDFKSLKGFEKNILAKTSNGFCDDAYQATLDASGLMKKAFDKKYGRGNYVFVSIGRSLETFSEAMSYMGADTRILPISGLHGYTKGADKIISQSGFDKYRDYLKQIGLDTKSIKESGKHYIFSDYSYYGDTMRTVKEMLESEPVGIKEKYVEFVDFEPLYRELYLRSKKPPRTIPEVMHLHLGYEYFKKFSSVKPLHYDNLQNVQKAMNSPQSYESKLFNFRLMRKLIKD